MTLWPVAGALVLAASAVAGIQTWRLSSLQADIATERMQAAVEQEQHTRAVIVAQQEASNAAAARTAQTRAALGRAVVAGDGLRQRAANLPGLGASAASGCDDAAASGRVLADVLAGMEQRGRAVAEWADELDTALDACHRAYGAVTEAAAP